MTRCKSRVFLTMLLLATTSISSAGGWSWRVKVDAYTAESERDAVVVLAVAEGDESGFGDCRVMRVLVRFNPKAASRSVNEEGLFSLSSHKEALNRLRSAMESKEEIRFGSIGSGLKESRQESCSFTSNGLAVLVEHGGNEAIYSYHEPV